MEYSRPIRGLRLGDKREMMQVRRPKSLQDLFVLRIFNRHPFEGTEHQILGEFVLDATSYPQFLYQMVAIVSTFPFNGVVAVLLEPF